MSFLLAWGSGLATPVHAGDPEERDPRGDEQPPRSPAWLPAGTELHLPGDGQSRPPAWSPARQATMYDQPDQAARLELVIKRIIVHDDGELFDEGELRMTIRFWRVNDGCPADKASEECISELARSAAISFSADDGDSVLLDRVFPADGDTVADDSIGPGIGIPVQVGQAYGWEIRGVEVDDVTSDDSLGWLRGQVHAGNGWGPPGAYIERGTRVDGGSPWRPSFAFRPAHFSVQYEIRHAALPDLRPAAIRVDEPPDARQPRFVCNVPERRPVAIGGRPDRAGG